MSDASDCSVCPLPVPATIQITGQGLTSSCQVDDYMSIDSEDEQDVKTNRLNNDSKLLSNAKQLLDYDMVSNSSVACATQETDAMSLASTTTMSAYSEDDSSATPQFNGTIDGFKTDEPANNNEQLDPKIKLQERTPATIAVANTIGAVKSRKFLKVLLDSGSVTTLINKSALPKGVQGKTLNQSKGMNTLAGKMTVNTMVKLRDLRLPEFNKNMSIESNNALVFDTPCRYDIIFGTDFLNKVGMKINFEDSVVEW